MDQVNSVMGPILRNTYADNEVEQINRVIIQSMKTMLEELGLVSLIICCFDGILATYGLPYQSLSIHVTLIVLII